MMLSGLLGLRILSALLLVGLFVFVSKRLHRGELSFTLGMVWSVAIVSALALSIAPAILVKLTAFLGVEVPSNLLFFLVQFFLVLIVFGLTLKSARQENKITQLSQELALLRLDTEMQQSEMSAGREFSSPTKIRANQ